MITVDHVRRHHRDAAARLPVIVTMLLVLFMVVLELAAARGIVAVPRLPRDHRALDVRDEPADPAGDRRGHRLRDLPASADIRKRAALGEDREDAYYTMFHGTAHVVLGSGLTIAGATLCLQLHPAAVLPDPRRAAGDRHAGRRGRRADARARGHHGRQPVRPASNPSARCRSRGWRTIGTAVVRWPGPDPGRDDRAVADRPAHAARLQDRATTTATTCPPTCRPTSATPRPTGTSRRPG